MPEIGPFSLVTLAFVLFSFVAWEVGVAHRGRLTLAFFAGVLLIVAAGRLLVGHLLLLFDRGLVRPASASTCQCDEVAPLDPAIYVVDGLILLSFLILLAATAANVVILAATSDPS